MKISVYLLFICTFVTKVIWCDTEAKMKILGSLTATGTMKNFAKDTSKTVKLATEIKNMLNGMCTNNKHQNSYEKFDKKVQNLSTDMEVIKEKLDKIQNLVSNIKCNLPDEWTVIQRRYDGSVEFNRNWKDYENGFGDKQGEFWLGNKNIAQLTSVGNHELRIDVEDWDGNKRYAVYKSFSIGDASTKYRLSISNYSGNAGDGMNYFNGMKFTTSDQDNDKHGGTNCASHSYFKGGWWYRDCLSLSKHAMLNGHYTHRNNTLQGIMYKSFKKTSLKKSTMKIRKV
ncbi:angiopoietin-related protein 2-like isoform X1 [Mytilus galloprovincialis]|uniref:angiopoietin-related protein 2-like isoform X1 n=1 Tax=Mytilus galloprovincialis TaxID=29158 RepID=UPI003F7CC631